MKKFILKSVPVCLLIVLSAALVPVYRAQVSGTATRIVPVPDGVIFSVDGQNYTHAASALWPAGSKHTLFVSFGVQDAIQVKTRLIFKDWEFSGGTFQLNPFIVTADPAITEYRAVFDVQYALSVVFFSCPDPSHCPSSGVVYVNNVPITSSQDTYLGAGTTATLQAFPSQGYVFEGWQPGPNQAIQGFQNIVTLSAPVTVYPKFQVARRINLASVPPGLQVLADRAPVFTPTTLEWGWGSLHSVGPVSPQQDRQGKWWVFSSWSDGGASTHAYQVAQTGVADTLTATYVPGAAVAVMTSPPGLKLKVDGRDNWPSYYFDWGIGETHNLEAPAQQTDAQGRIWAFSGWSNGGAAVQDFTVPAGADAQGLRLTATYSPVGRLTVNSPVSGLTVKVDGADCKTPCDIQRPVGTEVRVSAPSTVPLGDGARADFSGWPGGAGELVMTLGADPQTVSANYHTMNRLSAAADPSDGAAWNLQPRSADGFYDSQTVVAVSLTAQPGYRFRRWDGDLSGTIPSGMLSMNAPRAVRALLDRVPYIAPAGVSNGAGNTPQPGVSPGSVISVFGASLASAVAVGPDSALAQTLGGITVRVGDHLLPLFFVSSEQINLQLPVGLPEGAQTLTVSSPGQPDARADFTVVRNAPGLFQQAVNGQSLAVALHEDGSAVAPDSPARRGELLTVYGTGFGPTGPTRPEGFAVPRTPPFLLLDAATAIVGDAVLAAENAFAAPGRIGIDAVQFRLSDGAPSGTNAPLRVRVNGQDSNTVLLPVE